MASPGHSNLRQMEDTSVQVPTCGHFCGSNVMLRFLYVEIGNLKLMKLHLGLNNGPSPGHSNLSQMEGTSLFRCPLVVIFVVAMLC